MSEIEQRQYVTELAQEALAAGIEGMSDLDAWLQIHVGTAHQKAVAEAFSALAEAREREQEEQAIAREIAAKLGIPWLAQRMRVRLGGGQ